jgi:hypothetical protein
MKYIKGTARAIAMSLMMGFFATPAFAQENIAEKGAGAGLGAFMLLVLFVLGTGAFGGFTLIWHGLFPRRVEWTGEIARRMPWGSFFFGLVAAVVVLIIVAILGNAGGGGGVLALIILSAFILLFVTFGKVAIIEWAGELIDPAASGMRRALLGAGALILMLLIPIGGWLVLAGLGMAGIGAALVSYIPTRAAPPKQEAAPVEQEHIEGEG